MEQGRVAERFCSSGQDGELRFGGERLEPLGVAPFDLGRHRLAARESEPAGELSHAPGAGELEEGERVPLTLGDDLIADRCIQWTAQVVEQQGARGVVGKSVDGEGRELVEDVVADARTRGAHDGYPLGQEAAADEPEDLRR